MSDSKLQLLCRRVRRRLLIVGGAAGVLWGLFAATFVLLASVWLDLLWDLSPTMRIVSAASACGAAFVAATWLAGKTLRAAQPPAVMWRVDDAGRGGGMIVSGWELSSALRGDGQSSRRPLTAGLAALAVDQAAHLAERVPPWQVIPSRPALHAAMAVVAVFGAIGIAALSMPALVQIEWQRFLNPYGDVPPFSVLRFQVEPGDTRVIYGNPLDVRVQVEGAPVDRVELVFRSAGGDEEAIAMFPETQGSFHATLAKIDEPATYFVRAERARSRRFNVDLITVPQIKTVRFHVKPPEYTRDPDYKGPLPKEGLTGLVGTKVQVWTKSNRPLSGGTIQITGGTKSSTVAMQAVPDSKDEVTANFTIEESGKFTLSVVDQAGEESQETFAGAITLLHDQRPFIRILQPRAMSLATPETNLPISIDAEDDYGLARLQLFRSLNNSRPLPLELPCEQPAPRRIQERTYLPLSQYGLLPGDEIKLFARVEDNDPAGAKGVESSVVTIRIIAQEEFERMLRARQGLQVLLSKYQQAQRRMERLAEQMKALEDRLERLPPESTAAQEIRDELKKLAKQVREEARAIEESANHLLPYDLDKNLTDQLQQLAKNLNQVAQSLEELESNAQLSREKLLAELQEAAKKLASGKEEYKKKATEPLDHLALIYPLLADESKFLSLVMRQRDLAERMATLKGHDGEDDPALKARMRDLEQEQRTIREDLNELLQDIEDHVAQLPDDRRLDNLRATATDFVAAVRASPADQTLLESENSLAEFAGTLAHKKAVEAADILASFLSQCNGLGQACEGCLAFSPGLANCLGDTVKQLLAETGLTRSYGSGLGEGSGNGYSARSSNLNNVGLYGGLPGLGPEGSGRGAAESGGGSAADGLVRRTGNSDEPMLIDSKNAGSASGAGQPAIPVQYRQRVGQYLQRLAEELGQ